MEIQTALNDQLDFIRWFYFTAEPPFQASKRECLPHYTQRDGGQKWRKAAKGLEVLGQCSLSLVAKAIHDYLRESVRREGVDPGSQKKNESWFDYYCCSLEQGTTFGWAGSPVARDRIEQINLCRNDFLHDPGIDSGQPKKSEHHFKKHPLSPFDDECERAVGRAMAQANGEEPRNAPGSLTVSRHALTSAIADARKFCTFVETHRTFKTENRR